MLRLNSIRYLYISGFFLFNIYSNCVYFQIVLCHWIILIVNSKFWIDFVYIWLFIAPIPAIPPYTLTIFEVALIIAVCFMLFFILIISYVWYRKTKVFNEVSLFSIDRTNLKTTIYSYDNNIFSVAYFRSQPIATSFSLFRCEANPTGWNQSQGQIWCRLEGSVQNRRNCCESFSCSGNNNIYKYNITNKNQEYFVGHTHAFFIFQKCEFTALIISIILSAFIMKGFFDFLYRQFGA